MWPMTKYAVLLISMTMMAGCSRNAATVSAKYLASGDEFVADGKLQEAALEYQNAIRHDPNSVVAHQKLADIAARTNDFGTAAGEVLRLASLKSGDVGAQVEAGAIYLLAGRFEEARDRAEAALQLSGDHSRAYLLLGQALANLHDPEQSELQFQTAARLAPRSPAPHVALGSFYWSNGRTSDAE